MMSQFEQTATQTVARSALKRRFRCSQARSQYGGRAQTFDILKFRGFQSDGTNPLASDLEMRAIRIALTSSVLSEFGTLRMALSK